MHGQDSEKFHREIDYHRKQYNDYCPEFRNSQPINKPVIRLCFRINVNSRIFQSLVSNERNFFLLHMRTEGFEPSKALSHQSFYIRFKSGTFDRFVTSAHPLFLTDTYIIVMVLNNGKR